MSIGISGNVNSFDILRSFVEEDLDVHATSHERELLVEAKTYVPVAFGCLLHQVAIRREGLLGRNDEPSLSEVAQMESFEKELLAFLRSGAEPDTWLSLPWVAEDDFDLRLRLARRSLKGLAYSGVPEARQHLKWMKVHLVTKAQAQSAQGMIKILGRAHTGWPSEISALDVQELADVVDSALRTHKEVHLLGLSTYFNPSPQ